MSTPGPTSGSTPPRGPVLLFAGPSAHGLAPALLAHSGTVLQPPVRRGDLRRLLADGHAPAVAVVCDGVFQSEPAVSHAEICGLLDAGWQVWGVSSIGAIRAHEMAGEGMRGFGWVHAQFALHDALDGDFTDDELCLLHLPMAPWQPLTEALVNLRYALQQQGALLGIAPPQQQLLLTELRALWFGHRSTERMRALMLGPAGIPAPAADALLAWLVQHRIKTLDLQALLQQQPWLD